MSTTTAANQKISDVAAIIPEENPKLPSRRSPEEGSKPHISCEESVSQTADPNASAADAFELSDAAAAADASERSSGHQKLGGLKRRAVSPSLSSSTESSRKTTRLLFPNGQCPSKCSDPASIESSYMSSDEPESEPSPLIAQLTPSPSLAQGKKRRLSGKPHAVRPTSEPRTASAPTPLTGGSSASRDSRVKRAQEIDGDIEDQLRQPKKPGKRDKELGYVYVVPAEIDGTRVIKIGHTTEASVNTRLKGITAGKCESTIQILPLEDTSPEHIQVHLFYKQVEKLAHKELANFRHDFICSCGRRHEEFFGVDEEIGHMVVERWARLCALRPFDEDCVLKDEWEFHLDRFRERYHGRLSQTQHERKDDHLSRHQRWESFLASKRWDWHRRRAGVLLKKKMWSHFWQLWSFLLSMVLLFTSTVSWWSFGLLLGTTGGICLEESARNSVVELASLLRDVTVQLWRAVFGNSTLTTGKVKKIDEITDDREALIDISEDFEEESEIRDGEHDEQQEETEKEGDIIEDEIEEEYEEEYEEEERERTGSSEILTKM